MSFKLSTHLYRNRHGTFYFRFVIPKDLRPHIIQREVRFSLGTEQRHEAIHSAIQFIAGLPQLKSDLKRMADDNETPTPDYFKKWRDQMFANESLKAQVKILKAELAEHQECMAQMVGIDKAKKIVTRAAKTFHEKGQLAGKQELEKRLMFPPPPEETPLFSELKASYLKGLSYRAEGGKKKPPTPKSLDDYDKSIESFIVVMGDCRIGAIGREVVGEYFSILRKLPRNMNRLPKYQGKEIPELLAMQDTPQSEANCSKKIERASAMFKWALEEKRKWGIDANPFTGYGQADDGESKRRPFNHEELLLILNHPNFIKREFPSAYSFWLIPLAVYTGARLGELAQLDLKDFVEVEGAQCIDINDADAVEIIKGEGGRKKRVKTKNAKRLVPIHPELIRIGILRYVATLSEQNQQQLFPELSRKRRDGPAHAASNWFARVREKIGITDKEAVFHSFRHLFITNILNAGITPHMVAPIVGHEAELITGQVYWHKRDAKMRQPTVEAFTIDEDIRQLFPRIEDVTFAPPRAPKRTAKRT